MILEAAVKTLKVLVSNDAVPSLKPAPGNVRGCVRVCVYGYMYVCMFVCVCMYEFVCISVSLPNAIGLSTAPLAGS